MTQPSEEEKKLWESIALLAEQGSSTPPEVAEESQRPSFSDRLAGRLMSGTLPLFLLSLLALVLMGPKSHTSAFLAGPLLAAVFCWLLAPLSRRGSDVSTPHILLLGLPVALFTVLSQVLPLTMSRSYLGKEKIRDYLFALDLQSGLETLFSPPVFFPFVLAGSILALGTGEFARRHPWVDRRNSPTWRVILAWLTLLMPFLLGVFFTLDSKPSPEAQSWLEEAHELRRQRIALLSRRDEEESLPQSPGSSLSQEQQARSIFSKLRVALEIRPKYQYLEVEELLRDEILSSLTEEELSLEQAVSWLRHLEALDAFVPNRHAELDLNAVDYFLPKNKESGYLTPTEFSSSTWTRRVPEFIGDGYGTRTKTRPRPLKILGTEIPWSPTRVHFLRNESKVLENWLALRRTLRKMSPKETSKHLQDLQGPSYSSPKEHPLFLLEALEGRDYSSRFQRWLRTGILLAKLRITQMETGQYPLSLPLDEGWEQGVWSWEPEKRRLEGTHILGPRQSVPVWELP